MNVDFIRSVGVARWCLRTAIRQSRKRILGRGIDMRLPTGRTLSIPRTSAIGSEVFVTDADVDQGAEAMLARLCNGGEVFLDVGANIGYYSVYMSPCVARVHAFEPDPRAYAHLETLERRLPNVRTHAVALSDSSGVGSLVCGAGSEVSRLGAAADDGVPTTMRTLDSFGDEFAGRVAAIKIDTEGHDHRVLAGARGVIASDRPLILIETVVSATIVEWADARRYAIGAPIVARPPERPRFRWFSGPDPAPVKMIFLVPQERVPDVSAAAAELYDGAAGYRASLRRFRRHTTMLAQGGPGNGL